MRSQLNFNRIAIAAALLSWGAVFAESELNDNANTANLIAVNIADGGRLGDSVTPSSWDTYDWYTVTTPDDGKLTIKTSTSGGLDLQPFIYCSVSDKSNSNPGGDWLSPGGDAVNDSVTGLLRAGTVYVQVIRRSGTGPYSIVAQFTPAVLINDVEMNDTVKLAIALDPNATKTGHLGYYSTVLSSDGVDWYKINVPSDGRLSITTITSGGNLDLQPYIYRAVYDTNGINPSGDWASPVGDTIRDTASDALRAGIVWIEVLRRGGIGSYEIKSVFTAAALTNDAEINDTPRVAQAIAMNTPFFTGHMGYYSTKMSNDVCDWFTFTIPDEGKVSFTSITSDGNLNIHYFLYRKVYDSSAVNSSGDYVNSRGDAVNDTVTDYLRAGTFYLQVVRSGGVGSYTIVPTFQQALYAADVEPNNTPNQSISLAYNAVATGRMGYYSYGPGFDSYDWWAVTVPAACTLKVKIVTTGTLTMDHWIYSVVSDMNASNPGGSWVSGYGNGTNDTASIYAVPGITYYVQMVRSGGVGSYVIATGMADPVAGVINQKPGTPPQINNRNALLQNWINENVPISIKVYDLRGRVVLSKIVFPGQFNASMKSISANGLRKGAYLVEVTSNNVKNINRLQILR